MVTSAGDLDLRQPRENYQSWKPAMRLPGIYHERQSRHLCGLHALNNLFQGQDMFTKSQLDEYCYKLTPRYWLNPHRSWFGWGNYDINVIMYALEQRHCEAIWFDRRRDPRYLDLEAIFGFILNVPSQVTLGSYVPLPFQMRHWMALRCIEGNYYNLDSKLRRPQLLGSEAEFLDYLRDRLQANNEEYELFLVLEVGEKEQGQEAEADRQRWLLPQFRNKNLGMDEEL